MNFHNSLITNDPNVFNLPRLQVSSVSNIRSSSFSQINEDVCQKYLNPVMETEETRSRHICLSLPKAHDKGNENYMESSSFI